MPDNHFNRYPILKFRPDFDTETIFPPMFYIMQSWYQVKICFGLKFIWTEILRKLNIRAFKLKLLMGVNFVIIFFAYQEFKWSVQVIWAEVNNKLLNAPVGSYPRNHCLPPPVKRKYALFHPSLVPILPDSFSCWYFASRAYSSDPFIPVFF